jgi:hypothetical protein
MFSYAFVIDPTCPCPKSVSSAGDGGLSQNLVSEFTSLCIYAGTIGSGTANSFILAAPLDAYQPN